MKKYPRHAIAKNLLLLVSLINFGLLAISSWLYWQNQNQRIVEAKQKSKKEAVFATLEIERKLRDFQKPVSELANFLARDNNPNLTFNQKIEREFQDTPELLSYGVAYNYYAYSDETMLYAPGLVRANNKIEKIDLNNIYDYTQPQYYWFREALENGNHWGEPYYWAENSILNEIVFGFYSPFYSNQKTQDIPQGVVYGEYSFTEVEQIINSLNLGKTGYGFLLSRQGNLIAHPDRENVIRQKNITDLIQRQNNRNLTNLVALSLQNQTVETEFIDGITGKKSWLFLKPLELNGWVVGIVFFEEEVLLDAKKTRRYLIVISIFAVLFLLFLSAYIFCYRTINTINLWGLSIVSSLLFAVEIALVWRLALAEQNYLANRTILLNQGELQKTLKPHLKVSQQIYNQEPKIIPTGVFIQSIKFGDPGEVFISAYIWQKYEIGIHDDLDRGFILPDAVDANDLEIREAYNHRNGNWETVGWYVEATLRQDFDFSKYPLDRKNIEIQIWHQNLEEQVILVPDLAAYKLINPKLKPGINTDLVLDGWTLESSFFEYKIREFNTNFGFSQKFAQNNAPSLYFTTTVKREFIDALISKLVALICVVSLLFAMLIILESERAMEVLGVAAGLIFIVIVDQIAVREAIAAKGIIYFDFFYFVIYLFIFFVGVNALMLIKNNEFLSIISYKNNLPAKLLYWPSLLGVLMILTILVFF